MRQFKRPKRILSLLFSNTVFTTRKKTNGLNDGRSPRQRNIVECVTGTHNFLGSNYLQVASLFTDFAAHRRVEVDLRTVTSLAELHTVIRTCSLAQLPQVYFKRGELLFKSKKYEQSVVDFQQSLELSRDPSTHYMVNIKRQH